MTPAQQDALFDLALRLAQDLREYADAAEEAGEHIQATDVLLEEFDELVRTLDQEAHEESYDKPLPEWAERALAGGRETPPGIKPLPAIKDGPLDWEWAE